MDPCHRTFASTANQPRAQKQTHGWLDPAAVTTGWVIALAVVCCAPSAAVAKNTAPKPSTAVATEPANTRTQPIDPKAGETSTPTSNSATSQSKHKGRTGASAADRPNPLVPPKSLDEQQADEEEFEANLAAPEVRIREGTELVNSPGHFRTIGDRVAFFTQDEKTRLLGLENLNLERIAQAITQNPEHLKWRVTGVVTEFRGENYLLIQRAVLESERFEQDTPF